MHNILKSIYFKLPRFLKRPLLRAYEIIFMNMMQSRLRSAGENVGRKSHSSTSKKTKPRILFYNVSALSFGGTEKFLQIIAKHIDKDAYDVYVMYSPKPRATSGNIPLDGRRPYLEGSGVTLIEFDYERIGPSFPYELYGMKPSFVDVIQDKEIDFIVGAGPGYSDFPLNTVKDIPIMILNVFGSPTVQPNVVKNICISKEVADKIRPIALPSTIEIMPIQLEDISNDPKTTDPLSLSYQEAGTKLRESLSIPSEDFVFGRIGRPDDGIFDPIGIEAFEKVVAENPKAHYIIMAPPPILRTIVKERNIPNVHLLDPSANEKDVWAFHFSLDTLAHFRLDGESFGLNIAESMMAGNPVLTHKSHIWNAHLEYLEPSFSLVAERNDPLGYAENMKKMIRAKETGTITGMRKAARKKAEEAFVIDWNIKRIEVMISEALAK